MLNPAEIANKKFDRTMGKNYKAEDVDHYLRQVADDADALIADKRELEQKLLVLADKLEEYKNDEESLRSAILGAQKLGDSVIRDSKARASQIIDEAEAKANSILDDARRSIEKEQAAFVRIQREVATFKSKLQLAYKQHLELISSIHVDESILDSAQKQRPAESPSASSGGYDNEPLPDEPLDNLDGEEYPEDIPAVNTPLEYTDELLEYTDSRNEEDSYRYPEPSSDPEPEQLRRDSRFGPLKFGKEFDLKRDNDKRKK